MTQTIVTQTTGTQTTRTPEPEDPSGTRLGTAAPGGVAVPSGRSPRRFLLDGAIRLARTLAFFAVSMVLVFGLWMGAIKGLHLDPYFAKTPMDIWRYLTQGPDAGANRSELGRNLATTLQDAALGYGVGTALAVSIAVTFVMTAAIERTFMPIAVALRSVPLVAMTPLLALVFGRGLLGVTVVVGIVTFFPTLVYVVGGLRNVPPEIMWLMSACGANRWTIMRKVRFFYGVPALFASARIAVPGAILGAVVAEFLVTGKGLGYLMLTSSSSSRYDTLYASVLLVTVFAAVVYAIVGFVEALVLPRLHPLTGN